MIRRVALTFVVLLFVSFDVRSQAPAPIRGFTAADSAAERKAEDQFRGIPKAANLRERMRVISESAHHAGSPGSKKVADYILAQFKSFGLNASIEEFDALMPYPTERSLELVAPEHYQAKLQEPPISEDPTSSEAGYLPTFNAYSADGDITGDLVYVNYGTPADYEQLAKLGVDVKGKIVIARYGESWRGIKPKVAYEHGAIGCIIYSDPHEDGYFQGDTYPGGAYRPEHGVQRGSIMDMPVYPGDPLSPGKPSEPGTTPALTRSQATTIMKIPVLPISYGDALPLLRHLKGPVAPESWRGALPITYHVGAGPAKVHLKLAFDWSIRPLYDVIARIDGSEFPDAWIIHGNHHDAWVNGAGDPTSGQAALMETARAFGQLLKTGWRPKRTIILAAWDGEEWGLLGSTEWAEKHAAELSQKAAVYINSDSTAKGWLEVSGSHSLQAFSNDLMRDLPDPKKPAETLFASKLDHAVDQAKTDADKTTLQKRRDFPIAALGSGSDYTAFLDYLTVASLSMQFGGEGSDAGVYHSLYDSFYWYTHFSDTDFTYGTALASTIGVAMMRLADADVLPFEFTGTAKTLAGYVTEIKKLAKDTKDAPALNFAPLDAAIARLQKSADAYNQAFAHGALQIGALDGAKDAQLNRLLYTTERDFKYEPGLPRREWFKHLIYAPGFYTGYGVKTLPGIREGIEQKAWDEPRKYIPIVSQAIDKLAAQVDQAAALLGGR
ncbi:MAG: transferrin receptor-like dimerization domain-containing protein [Vicinamibacterales bacterium]